ncbi:putative heme-binding protein [Thelohanellus kitauei]|uniref:Putative heme-binding protein n=1 Tax=Thelohanellus kitauei TaxID=669202 RepID=A0A0C2M139_THEKT|nr:putative heme-binding protein [Thelohanellus kitauei]
MKSLNDWRKIQESEQKSGKVKFKPRAVTMDEVQKHCKSDDCWIVLGNNVYEVTDFLEYHPGGPETILEYAGKDGTKAFIEVFTGLNQAHQYVNFVNLLSNRFVGVVRNSRS